MTDLTLCGGRLSSGMRPKRVTIRERVIPMIEAAASACRTNGQVDGNREVEVRREVVASSVVSAQRDCRCESTASTAWLGSRRQTGWVVG